MLTTGVADEASALLPGETVLWTGRPAARRLAPRVTGSALFQAPVAFLLAIAGWAIPLHGTTTLSDVAMAAEASLFALLGVAAPVCQALTRINARRQVRYQITNWRIMITAEGRSRRTWSVYLDQVSEVLVKPHRNGRADLALRRIDAPLASRARATSARPASPFDIDDDLQEFPVLRSLRDGATAGGIIYAARWRMMSGDISASTPQPLFSTAALPAALRLGPGEQLLWAGRPGAVPWLFGGADLCASGFSLAVLAAAGLLSAAAIDLSPFFPAVLALLAVWIGGYGAIGRVLVRRLRLTRSTYVLTNQRVTATWQLFGRPVTAQAPLAGLLPPEVRGRSVLLRRAVRRQRTRNWALDQMTWPTARAGPPSLIGLADPGSVRDVICAAQLAARTHPTPPH